MIILVTIFFLLEKIKSDTINLTLCLWLFFSLKGLPSNQTPSSPSLCASTSARSSSVSIAKVVNPLGTVTTITESPRESILAADEFAEEYSSGAYIHENCDESMFRPYVAVISGSIDSETYVPHEKPEPIGQKLIVPVIDSTTLQKQNREKQRILEMRRQQDEENIAKFEQMSLLNRNDKKSEKSGGKNVSNKADEKNVTKTAEKDMKVDKAEKSSEKNVDRKANNDTETVIVKLKKKGNKTSTKLAEASVEIDDTEKKSERNVKSFSEACSTHDSNIESAKAVHDEKIECEILEEFVAPKPIKSKKKSLVESSSSKESSIEKELQPTPAEGTKSKKKKQKKNEAQSTASSSDDAKGNSASEGNSKKTQKSDKDMPDSSFLLENIDNFDGAQCAEIQESLLKNSVSATVSIRKSSYPRKIEDGESNDPKPSSKSGKKKKWSKESIDFEPITSNSPNAILDTEFTYPDPSESVIDLDNLSFKSTIDDQISMIPMESLQSDTDWMKERTNDYDKLSDDAETGSGAHYSDCKSFQLIIDEPESYMRTSDTNSSDETEDSSQSKSTKSSEKTVDEDDEELQPLICSTTSDAAVDLSKFEALPSDVNQSDSNTQPQTSEQSQPQPQKTANTSNNNNNNKKKFRKKRR